MTAIKGPEMGNYPMAVYVQHSGLEKQGLELVDNTDDVLADSIDDAYAIAAATKGMVQAYRDGDLGLQVFITVRRDSGNGEVHDFVAVFDRAIFDKNLHVDGLYWDPVQDNLEQVAMGNDRDRVNDPVAVLGCEHLKAPESFVPSQVRLYLIDGDAYRLGELAYLVGPLAEPLCFFGKYGELKGLGVEPFLPWKAWVDKRWVLFDGEVPQGDGEVIQGGAVVVEEDAQNTRKPFDLVPLRPFLDDAVERDMPPLAVELNEHSVRIRSGELCDVVVEGLAFLICPPQSAPHIAEFRRPRGKPVPIVGYRNLEAQ